jgi:hypothetical protein
MDALRAGDDLGEDKEKDNGNRTADGSEGDYTQDAFNILYHLFVNRSFLSAEQTILDV